MAKESKVVQMTPSSRYEGLVTLQASQANDNPNAEFVVTRAILIAAQGTVRKILDLGFDYTGLSQMAGEDEGSGMLSSICRIYFGGSFQQFEDLKKNDPGFAEQIQIEQKIIN